VHLGIDFGTTRTVVAACDRGNYPIVSFASEDGDFADWYPSLVAERNGELRCGWAAHACASDPSWVVLRSFKRMLTEPTVRPDHVVKVGSLRMPLIDLLVTFLRSLHNDLRSQSSMQAALHPLESIPVMIATPANAHGTQRFLTIDAFQKSGFQVLALLNEPSAAGFEYAHRYRSTITSKREHVVVYDLGGGTFDASLVRMNGQNHDIVYTSGIPRLGGDDFDTVLADLVLGEKGMMELSESDPRRERLVSVCREAKESLVQGSRRVLVDVESAWGEHAPVREVALPVSTFYEACTPLIEQSIEAMMHVVERGEGGGDTRNLLGIAGIYVVGGASALPAVGRTLKHKYGRRVHRSPYPSAATAIGLAIAGDKEAGYRLADRFSRVFGVFRELRDNAVVSFDPVFTKDTCMPLSQERCVTSSRTYRAAHNIGHFRYVECDDIDSSGVPSGDITPFAEALFPFDPMLCEGKEDLRTIPVRRLASPGPLVEERYTVDADGIVEVSIRNLDAGYEKKYRLWG